MKFFQALGFQVFLEKLANFFSLGTVEELWSLDRHFVVVLKQILRQNPYFNRFSALPAQDMEKYFSIVLEVVSQDHLGGQKLVPHIGLDLHQ